MSKMKLHTKIYKRLEKQHPEFSRAQLVDVTLLVWSEEKEGYGIEVIRSHKHWSRYYGDIAYLYVNMGDSYVTTLIYDVRKDKFMERCIGDILEKL